MVLSMAPGIVLKNDNEVALLVDTQQARYQKLNSSALFISELIQKNSSMVLDEVLEAMSDKYSIPVSLMEEDVTKYIKDMVAKHYFTSSNENESDDSIEVNQESKSTNEDYTDNGIWIKVTDRCNLHCSYCYANSGENNDLEELSIQDIERILQELEFSSTNKIVITGGEPLIRKDILDIVKKCKEYSMVQVLTNGTIGDEAFYRELLESVDMIQISLDSYDEIKHEEGRGKGSFKKALRTIDIISGIEPRKLTISMTPTPDYIAHIPTMIDFCLEHQVYSLHINRFVPYGRAHEQYEDSFDLKDFYNWVDEGYAYLTQLYKQAMERRMPFAFQLDVASDVRHAVFSRGTKRSCGLNKNVISVDSEGSVYLCPSLHVEAFRLGNIYESSMIDIIKASQEKYGSFCVDDLHACKECDVKYFCGGGCRALALNDQDDIYGVDNNCGTYKQRVVDIMMR